MAKMSNRMITLCSAAVSAIYITGYVITEQAQANVTDKNIVVKIQNGTLKQPNTVKQDKVQNQKVQSKIYKDGTFYGTGTTRIGSVEVAVTIKSDKIKAVEITNCDTHYSQSHINHLPQQVLDRQSSKIDIVSGATLSSEDFQWAVEEALQKAKM